MVSYEEEVGLGANVFCVLKNMRSGLTVLPKKVQKLAKETGSTEDLPRELTPSSETGRILSFPSFPAIYLAQKVASPHSFLSLVPATMTTITSSK